MIELRGTSHVASSDLKHIRHLIEERDPDVVALELDERRLKALLSDEEQHAPHNPFFLVLKKVQDLLGKRTGVAPGSDMLEAFKTAVGAGTDVALIDQDITVTLRRLNQISLLEKVKFGGFLVFGIFLFPMQRFDLRDVPEEDFVERLLLQFQISFPGMYDVLVEERNYVMAEKLKALDEEYDHVLAFVGAGHVQGINELLEKQS